jgi:hypothetical protein
LSEKLSVCDVVGFSGSTDWSRFDWINGPAETKEACVWLPCGEREGLCELNLYTSTFRVFDEGFKVLDGGCLIMKGCAFSDFVKVEWPFEEGGPDFLYEQYATYKLGLDGRRLGVYKNLGAYHVADGLIINKSPEDEDIRRFVGEELDFEVSFQESDYSCISFPFDNVASGTEALAKTFLSMHEGSLG